MSTSERLLGIVKDVVLPVDVRTRYDVYFTDRRVGIVCLGRAERFESETEETLSYMPSAFGVPAPVAQYTEKTENRESIDEKIKDLSLDDLLKLSKKSCFYTVEEIEKVELVWGKTPKFVILSQDCESKFAPNGEQFDQLIEIIPTVEGLKDKLWIAGKWTALYGENQAASLCEACGASNDIDAVYCQNCGKRLGEETVNVPSSELTCSRCGTKNKAQASFCKQCGASIRAK
ncbi:MAG: zinc ribbon domain-containing protein [Candidatus Bathyarchaeia archaeon]|jgi:ribosomal protein L40E